MPIQPFGDIFEVRTPYLDQLGERIYAEERQREQQRIQQNRMLDEEFSRNLSGIRDSDIGDLTKAYGDFKIANQSLMRKKQGGTPEEQLEVLRKKAAVYDVLNKSKQEKEWEDMQLKLGSNDKKGLYADDWQEKLRQRRLTPISKLDRTKDGDLLYKYSVPDLEKELKFARGDKRPVSITLGVSKVDPMKDDKEVYEVNNTPAQFANRLLEQIVTKNQGRNFTGVMNNKYDEKELEDLKNKYYAKVNDPKFVAIYGKVEPLPNTDTELGKAVAIRTMEEYAPLDLKPARIISELNQDRARTRSEEFQLKKQRIGHQNTLENIRVSIGLRGNDPEVVNRNVDGSITSDVEYTQEFGEIPMAADKFKAITGVEKSRNSYIKADDSGNYEYGTKDKDGNFIPSGKVPRDDAKFKLTKAYKSGLSGDYNTGDKPIPKPKENYTQVTETNKGTIGVKNGKWYYIKTGKPVE